MSDPSTAGRSPFSALASAIFLRRCIHRLEKWEATRETETAVSAPGGAVPLSLSGTASSSRQGAGRLAGMKAYNKQKWAEKKAQDE